MGQVEVDPFELSRSGEVLCSLAGDLGAAAGRVEGLRSKALGSRRIDLALNHFADEWGWGLGLVVDRVREAGESLLRAGVVYRGLEEALSAALRGEEQPGG